MADKKTPEAAKEPSKPTVVQPDHALAVDGKTKVVRVKAKASPSEGEYAGEYGHKRRRPGEVFDMHTTGDLKELPSWVEKADKGEEIDVPESLAPRAEGTAPVASKKGGKGKGADDSVI